MSCPQCRFKGSELNSFGYTETGLFEWVRCEACNKRYTIIYERKQTCDTWIKPEDAVEVN